MCSALTWAVTAETKPAPFCRSYIRNFTYTSLNMQWSVFQRTRSWYVFFFFFVLFCFFFRVEVPLCTSLLIDRWALTDTYVPGGRLTSWSSHVTFPVETSTVYPSEGVFHHIYFWPGNGQKINERHCTLFLIAGAYFAFILWKKTTWKQTVILSRKSLSGSEAACNWIRPYFTTSN